MWDRMLKGGGVDLEKLNEIIELMERRSISEFEMEEEGVRIKIKRGGVQQIGQIASPIVQPMPTFVANTAAPSPVAQEEINRAEKKDEKEEEGLVVVPSPIVGTFYRAPDPNSSPFVNVGDRVRIGQVLCIVEAMKLMNEIEAEIAGIVVKIHQENGQPVQYGAPLFSIRPD
jgi:acetyl-CoA carboxylase biotin carboxyl carrier protein